MTQLQKDFISNFLRMLPSLHLLMHQVWAGFYSQSGAISWLRSFSSMIPNMKPEQFLSGQYIEVPANGTQLSDTYESFLKIPINTLQEITCNLLRSDNLSNELKESLQKVEQQFTKVKNQILTVRPNDTEMLTRDFLYSLANELTLLSHYLCATSNIIVNLPQI